jgi:hypothetical protein
MEKIERLIKMVYRFFKSKEPKKELICPDEEMLVSFLEGKLSSDEDIKLQEHILSCRRCSEIVLFFELKEEKEVPEYLIEKVKGLIKKEIPLWLELAIAFKERGLSIIKSTADILLGNEILPLPVLRARNIEVIEKTLSLIRDFGDIRIQIEINKTEKTKVKLTVSLLDKKSLKPQEDMRVGLFKQNREIESYALQKGTAVFEDLEFGEYEIKVSKDLEDLGLIKLTLV